MKLLKNTAKSLMARMVMCVAALALVAGTGCEIEEGGYIVPWNDGQGGDGSFDYGSWGGYNGSGTYETFHFNENTDIDTELENILIDGTLQNWD